MNRSAKPAVLMSIRTRHAEAIMRGEKTVELRRNPPQTHPPTPVVIYSSRDRRAVVGSAVIVETTTLEIGPLWESLGEAARVSQAEFEAYFDGRPVGHALHLRCPQPAAVEVPLALARSVGAWPPQSWRYIDHDVFARLRELMSGSQTMDPLTPRSLRCLSSQQRLGRADSRIPGSQPHYATAGLFSSASSRWVGDLDLRFFRPGHADSCVLPVS